MRFQVGLQIVAAATGVLLAVPARSEVIERVLAIVAGDLILLSDVNAAREFGLVDAPSTENPAREILSRLIDRSLMLAEVDRFAPPEPDAPAIDARLEQVRSRFASSEAFAAALARVGIDERYLREGIRQNLRIASYLNQRFTTVPPSEEELARYYRDHPELFRRGGVLPPFETVRPDVVQAVTSERRRTVVDEWLAGLRRRADIRDLSALNGR